MVGSLSSCRRYAGDEEAVGSALAVADSLRYDAPAAADSIIRSLDADSLGSRANAALYALLANEVGRYGDQVAKEGDLDKQLADELADVMWVLICLANQTGIDLEEALRRNIEKKSNRDSQRHLQNEKLK